MPADDVTINIGAKDNATPVIEKVDQAASTLGKKKILVSIEGPPTDFNQKLLGAVGALKQLTEQGRKVDAASAAIKRALGDAVDPTQIVAGLQKVGISLDDITKHADQVGKALGSFSSQELGGLNSGIDKATAGSREMESGFEAAHGAISNMAGEAAGQLSEISGLGTEVSTAFSSIVESATEAAAAGGGFAEVIGGIIPSVLPLLAIGGAIALVTKSIEGMRERNKEIAEETRKIADGVSSSFEKIKSATDIGGDVGKLSDQLATFFTTTDEHVDKTVEALDFFHMSLLDLGPLLEDLGGNDANRVAALGQLVDQTAQFTDLTAQQRDSLISALGASTDYNDFLGILATNEDQMGVAMGTSNDTLRDRVALNKDAITQIIALNAASDRLKIGDFTKEVLDNLLKATGGVEAYQKAVAEVDVSGLDPDEAQLARLKRAFEILNDTANILKIVGKETKPVSDMAIAWERLGAAAQAAIKSGDGADQIDSMRELKAITDAYGISKEEAIKRAIALLGDEKDAQEASFAAAKAAHDTFIADKKAEAVSILDVEQALVDLGGGFSQLKLGQDAMQSAFDIHDVSLNFLGSVTDIHDGMRDLASFLGKPAVEIGKLDQKISDLNARKAKIKVDGSEVQSINNQIRDLTNQKGQFQKHLRIPNIFDPNDVDAGPFLAKIKSLRGPIQQQVDDAFATGGAQGALTTANTFVDQLFQVLGGKLSKGQIESLLGLDNLEATIKIAVDQKSKATAAKELELFTQLGGGETPFTATLALALESGKLSPGALQNILRGEFGKIKGFDISVLPKTNDADSANAVAEAQTFMNDPKHQVDMISTVGVPTNISERARETNTTLSNNMLDWPVELSLAPNAISDLQRQIAAAKLRNTFSLIQLPNKDVGGIVPRGGGIVGERRPEIINERYLVTEPTLVPGGTRVTSGARTARILRARGTRGLRRYDAGGTVAGGTTNVTTINVNAAVIGNRYDVMRAVRRAELDRQRLLGSRS